MKIKQIIEILNNSKSLSRLSPAIQAAHEKYFSLYKEKLAYEEMKSRQNSAIFSCTWQDSTANLAAVLRHVFLEMSMNFTNLPEIFYCAASRNYKGRKDVFILSQNNVEFRQKFYEVLSRMKNKRQ